MMPCCGLLTASKHPVPLKGISVDVQVKGFVADVSATLKYKNEEQNPLEAVFVFPMDADSAVYSFEALVDGKRIVAEIQEKKKAHQTYEDALAQGKEAFLLEEDESSGDIFSCSVGNLPPGQEAEVKLAFVQELPVEADGAVRFVLPAVLNPRYTPQDEQTQSVTANIPRAPKGSLPYTLELSVSLQSPYGIARVESNCSLTPLRYTKDDKTTAQISLGPGHQFDRDVELLMYYEEVNKPSVNLEWGIPNAKADSLMSETAMMLSFYPRFPEAEEQSDCGEFIFLIDCSGSMGCTMGDAENSPTRIDSAKETLFLLLKSLPVGCYFNIFSFGSTYDSFFPESVAYTQQTMESALEKMKTMSDDLGGTEILEPLKHIYDTAGKPGHPRQLFLFTDGEVRNTKAVIAKVSQNADKHRCFGFGIGEGASTALVKGISQAAGGTAEFITGKERMQPKALRSLKASLQPAVKNVSLQWTLPPGLETVLVSRLPTAIFRGQRSIIYSLLKGKVDETAQGAVSLEYTYREETFRNQLQLQLEKTSRATIHRLAAKSLIMDLERSPDSRSEEVVKRILETSLQSGVVSSLTAYVAVNKDLNQPIQGPLTRRDIPLAAVAYGCSMPTGKKLLGTRMCMKYTPRCKMQVEAASFRKKATDSRCLRVADSGEEDVSPQCLDSPLVKLISLQNADGSWTLSGSLASVIGTSEAELKAKMPNPGVDPAVWATVLAVIWLHTAGAEQRDEWELLARKAVAWLKGRAGATLADCIGAGNAVLKASVDAALFGL
ncbi:von Willebrand factor A domain-containing protein 5A isoform X2 [Microcaecilia unicolor]|uniref:von Willebrand factor A domain-containing protein 5A-like isoform X2 n=1 Tax=Microcaecilia unicolor TaxID=1415580 RepID=A0A6P7WQR5_9AMPH|nr:von Willebrand factor A domain-containing protein 5A-like isoform X2 [Microcaecilia unicolor]